MSWIFDSSTKKYFAIDEKAGKYISIDSGPIAIRLPRIMIKNVKDLFSGILFCLIPAGFNRRIIYL